MTDANLNSIDDAHERTPNTPRAVIVGGGFRGLAAAKALRKEPAQVILLIGQTITCSSHSSIPTASPAVSSDRESHPVTVTALSTK